MAGARQRRVLIAAGGTGGHIMPGVAVAQELEGLLPGAGILFVGAGRPAEAEILDPLGYPRDSVPARGIKGRGPLALVTGAARAFLALLKALRIVRRFRPDIVFGAGGYSSGPVGLAGFLLRVPLVIHEQNRRPGLTNRLLGRLAREVFLGDGKAAAFFPKGKALFTGNPVRGGILRLSEAQGRAGARGAGEAPTLLILGGSQGARGINRAVAGMIPLMAGGPRPPRVIHQAGAEGARELAPLYADSGLPFELGAFFRDMERLLSEADLVVSRAGALTLAELSAAALPAVLVPLPTAADDHQTENAKTFVEAGCAILFPEAALSPEGLWAVIGPLLGDPMRLASMREAHRGLGRPPSGRPIAERIRAIIQGPGAGGGGGDQGPTEAKEAAG